MAPNDREERRRMRQRGAGTSGLSVGNFGFTFGASALPAQLSARRTPRTLRSQPSSRRTPAAAAAPVQRSARKTPASTSSRRASYAPPAQASSRKSPAPLPPRASARKTPTETSTASAQGSSSARVTRSAQRRSTTPSKQDEPTLVTPSVTGKRKRPNAVTVPESQGDELEQNDEEHRTSARKSGNDSAQRSDGRRLQAAPVVVTEDAQDELEDNDADHTLSTEKGPQSSLMSARSTRAASSPGLFVTWNESSPLQTFKRPGRPRKSTGGSKNTAMKPSGSAVHRGRRSLHVTRGHEDVIEEEVVEREVEEEGEDLDGEEEEVEDDLSVDELSPAAVRRKSRHDPESDADSDVSQLESEGQTSDEEGMSGASTPQASGSNIRQQLPQKPPAPTRKPHKSQRTATAPARTRTRQASDRGPRIPVTVYRHSAPRKPADDASQIDELELPTPSVATKTRLPTVNAVDILAQITSELTARMSTSLLNQAAEVGTADKPRRAELTRRARTVDAFATELADRLFELTEAVDTGEALRGRVKAALKEKVALRSEFLSIRKEREEVALQMDAVRKAHMEAQAKGRRDEELSDALFGIETAVQRGREKAVMEGRQDEGPEMDVMWEVDEVLTRGISAVGPSGGLADRVQEFGGFLERAAGVVEGRL